MKNYFIGGVVVAVVILGWAYFQDKSLGGYAPPTSNQFSTATHSTVTVGLSTTGTSVALSNIVLAANSQRQYARCMNVNTNGYPISLMLGSTATTTGVSGIVLTPFASSTPNYYYEITPDNLFTGVVYAYSQGTSTLSCVSK